MPSKLDIVNDALANTSNNLATTADTTAPTHDPNDPDNTASFEWDSASRAYDRELPVLLERHSWPFARARVALVQAAAVDNPSNRYGYAYDWPTGCLWLERVEAPGGLALDYEIIGLYICMDYDGTGDDAPVASYVETPAITTHTNLFWEVLRLRVEVGCLRILNEDFSEASRREEYAEGILLPLVRNRTDQQTPPRRAFRSTMLERRRSGSTPTPL